MQFPLGKPILVMLGLAAVCGLAIALRPDRPKRADLVVWTFSDSHAKTYRGEGQSGPSLLQRHSQTTGLEVDVQQMFTRAQNVRLVSLFMSNTHGPAVPDLAEVEIDQVGKFFRPPAADVGFLPLNNYLHYTGAREIQFLEDDGQRGWNARWTADGRIYTHNGTRWVANFTRDQPDMWIDRIVRSRFAPYSKGDVVFGIPRDIHPIAIAFRHDLFLQAGIDLMAESGWDPDLKQFDPNRPLTWPRFQALCLRFQQHWAHQGVKNRHAIELRTGTVDDLLVLLLQRGLNPVDNHHNVLFNHPRFAHTIAFYAQLVAGDHRIGAQSGNTEASKVHDLRTGAICAYLTPDWRINEIKRWAGNANGQDDLQGAMRLIPLPIFEPGNSRTGTSGGTMIAIPRACPRPDEAWKLIEHLYLSNYALEARLARTSILPPLIEQWDHPAYDRPDPFFGEQKVDAMFIDLADEIPQRWVTPANTVANAQLALVLQRAIDHAKARGGDGLEEVCRAWLLQASDDLKRRIQWGEFE